MTGARVEVRALIKKFGNTQVLGLDTLTIEPGEFFALLGPSGSGKSSLLGAIAGHAPATSGQVLVDGQDITNVPPHRRNLGMVFQNYSLFPFLSVARNIAFPLEMRKVGRTEIDARVRRALEMVRLPHMADRLPAQLSGGQQQRVALARAAVYEPPLLLMDEPLGALDRNLREELQDEIRLLHKQLQATVIFVTHDQHEAASMADRIAVMRDGRLEQIGSPQDVYQNPRNAFVATFLGEANLFELVADEGGAPWHGRFVTAEGLRLAASLPPPPGADVACVRPENVWIATEGDTTAPNTASATIVDVMHTAGSVRYRLRVSDTCSIVARAANNRRVMTMAPGDTVVCGWDAADTLFIPGAARRLVKHCGQ